MQPKHGTFDVACPQMQPIPIPQINRRHANPLPPLLPRIILTNLIIPVFSLLFGTILSEANINQKVSVISTRLEAISRILGGEVIRNKLPQGIDGVPAPQVSAAVGFVVEGCA
jgi:hypothetical protein